MPTNPDECAAQWAKGPDRDACLYRVYGYTPSPQPTRNRIDGSTTTPAVIGVPVPTTVDGDGSGYLPEADQAAALEVTARFVDAWYAGGSDQAWRDQVSRWADPTLARELPSTDRKALPGSRRITEPAMRAFQPGLASTGVGTDAGSLALTVIYTDAGWRVVTVDRGSTMNRHRSTAGAGCCSAWPGSCSPAAPWPAPAAPPSAPSPRATSNGDCPPATVTGTAPGLDQAQEANAKTVVGVALGRGLGPTGAAIAVAAALAESSLYNYANDGTSTLVGSAEGRQLNDSERAVARQSLNYPHDKVGNNLDSIGLFQQRPMTGWGTPAELINPATATGKFLDQMVKVADWQTLSPWTVAQKVQGSPSSDGGIYRDSYQRATDIVASLDTTPAAPRPAVDRSPWSRP